MIERLRGALINLRLSRDSTEKLVLSYPVSIGLAEDGTVLASFPDVPGALSAGRTEDEAFAKALDVLETALAGYVASGLPLPTPSDSCGAPLVTTERFGLFEAEQA